MSATFFQYSIRSKTGFLSDVLIGTWEMGCSSVVMVTSLPGECFPLYGTCTPINQQSIAVLFIITESVQRLSPSQRRKKSRLILLRAYLLWVPFLCGDIQPANQTFLWYPSRGTFSGLQEGGPRRRAPRGFLTKHCQVPGCSCWGMLTDRKKSDWKWRKHSWNNHRDWTLMY